MPGIRNGPFADEVAADYAYLNRIAHERDQAERAARETQRLQELELQRFHEDGWFKRMRQHYARLPAHHLRMQAERQRREKESEK